MVALLAIVVVGFGLRVYQIDSRGLWYDEAATYWVAVQPWDVVWGPRAQLESSPPLYYALQKVWLVFGESPAALRSLSAIFGTLTIIVAFGLARTLGGSRVGLLTALMVSISGIHVYYSQEARTYALVVLLLTSALWALAFLLADPQRVTQPWRKRSARGASGPSNDFSLVPLAWAVYLVAVTGALYSHQTTVLFPVLTTAACAVYWWTTAGKSLRFARNWVLVHLAALAAYAWWLPAMISQATDTSSFWEYPAVTWSSFWLAVAQAYGHGSGEFYGLVWDVVIVGAFVLGIWTWRTRRRELTFVLTIGLGLPLLTTVVSIWTPILMPRTILWGAVPILVLVAAGVSGIRRPSLRRVAVVLVLIGPGLSTMAYQRNPRTWDAWRDAADYVKQHERPGDLVLFATVTTDAAFRFYHRPGEFVVPRYGLEARRREDRRPHLPGYAISEVVYLDELGTLTSGFSRVWFVSCWPPDRVLPPAELREVTREADVRSFGEGAPIFVRLLLPASSGTASPSTGR